MLHPYMGLSFQKNEKHYRTNKIVDESINNRVVRPNTEFVIFFDDSLQCLSKVTA
jgi:hypothetical protein